MTDSCDATARRPRDYSSSEPSCEPTREETATSQVAAQQAAEREAEARRNAYFASGGDEGGRSAHASSELAPTQRFTPDDKNARIIANSTKYDHPIESDPLGNAIIGIAAGGMIGGVEAGAGKVGLAGVSGRLTPPMSRALVQGTVVGEKTGAAAFARGAARGAVVTAAKKARNAAVIALVDASTADVPASVERHAAAGPTPVPTNVVAGQSSKDGASVPVPIPSRSEGPRIPEAWSPSGLRIQG